MGTCIVPKCFSKNNELFRVPNAGSCRFRAWSKKVPASGLGTERICGLHFKPEDFNENVRKKLDKKAVPKIKLPVSNPNVIIKSSGCSVHSCGSKNPRELVKMPAKNSSILQKWKNALYIPDDLDSTMLKICYKHFDKSDFSIVRSRYLKSSALPSKHLYHDHAKPIVVKRRLIKTRTPEDHGYARKDDQPRSRRMCFVYGCTVQASDGVFLHRFPKQPEQRNSWLHAIKSGVAPKKNSVVCSHHFHDSDYLAGSKKLKKNSVPSRNLPIPMLEQNQQKRHELNPYKQTFKRNSRIRELDPELLDQSSSSEEAIAIHTGITYQQVCDPAIDPAEQACDPAIHPVEPACDPAIDPSEPACDPAIDPSELACDPAIDPVDLQIENIQNLEQLPFFEEHHTEETFIVDDFINCTCIEQEINSNNIQSLDKSLIDRTISEVQSTRLAILSDFLTNDRDLNVWTGIPTTKTLEALSISAQHLENLYPKKFKMHVTDRIILTMARLKQNITFAALAILFRISPSTVSEYFEYTIQILSEILGQIIYWPSMEEIAKNVPFCFRPDFVNVRCVLDCTEIGISTPNCLNCRIACYSSYKNKRTAKILIGVTPAGMISYCSRAYSGKSSDKFIFNNENFIDKLEKHRDEIMVDKGFAITNECIENGIKLHIPPFLKDEQLSHQDAILNESIAKARIHVERAISRIKIFAVLHNTLDASMLKYIDSIMKVVCGIVNLAAPILKDDKF